MKIKLFGASELNNVAIILFGECVCFVFAFIQKAAPVGLLSTLLK